jgi:peptide/nickel transport system ATP-binding protein
MSEALLEVDGLRTHFFTKGGVVKAVDDVSFAVARGEVLGLVGESGSGKSMTGYSILGLVDPPGRVVSGHLRLGGRDLRALSDEQMRQLRGNRVAMIFQDPMMTLNRAANRWADDRGNPRAPEHGARAGARARTRSAREGRHPVAGRTPYRLSAPVLGWDAAAPTSRSRARSCSRCRSWSAIPARR